MREIEIKRNDANQRLDKFLSKALPKMPLSLLQKSIRKGRVRINLKKCTDPRRILEVGDILSLYINDEFFEKEPSKMDFLLAPSNLDIIYEDQNVLIINKPPALAVHDFENSGADTLINRVLKYLYDKKEYDTENETSFIPALANRIDRNTCGIVIAAKNAEALRSLNKAIKEHRLIKKYLCLTYNAPDEKSGTLSFYMKKLEDKKISLVSEKRKEGYKTAITDYKVLKKQGELNLIELTLKTGRTHQIRACLAHIGCAILGDGKYGKTYSQDKALGFPYQALCSYFLKFNFEEQSPLYYLNSKEFKVKDIWFIKK